MPQTKDAAGEEHRPRFSAEEILHVARTIMDTSDAILIGGQSLNLWAETYKSRRRELGELEPFESHDIDFLGSVKDVRACELALGGTARYPKLDDSTPEVGVIDIDVDGKPLQIDFLAAVAGLKNSAIRKAAVRLRYRDTEIRVLHPLNVLQSRLSNVCAVLGRTDPLAIRQMRAAVYIAAAYIEDVARQDEKVARKLIESVLEIARSAEALKLWHKHAIDIAEAVREYRGLHRTFLARRLPQLRHELEKRRARYRRAQDIARARKRPAR